VIFIWLTVAYFFLTMIGLPFAYPIVMPLIWGWVTTGWIIDSGSSEPFIKLTGLYIAFSIWPIIGYIKGWSIGWSEMSGNVVTTTTFHSEGATEASRIVWGYNLIIHILFYLYFVIHIVTGDPGHKWAFTTISEAFHK
jgi:hypothetical protein